MSEWEGPERRRPRGFRLTTKYQLSGWRFLIKRMRHALVRRDTRMIDDPQQYQASPLALGLVLAVVGLVGALVLGLVFPAGKVGNAKIIEVKQSGSLYIHLDDRLHPVTNLTSARLIIGKPDSPVKVAPAEISKYPSGPLVGILGAPNDIRDSDNPWSVWTICDLVSIRSAAPVPSADTSAAPLITTVAFSGQLSRQPSARAVTGNTARLVAHGGTTWLVYPRPDGVVVRSAIDLNHPIVTDALEVRPEDSVLPISRGLFNALPLEPPLDVPVITNIGEPPKFASRRSLVVGDILMTRAFKKEPKYYVALDDGIQEVGEPAAEMIANANSAVTALVEVDPGELLAYPKVDQLQVDHYPKSPVRLIPASRSPVTCWSWSNYQGGPEAQIDVLAGSDLPLQPEQQASAVNLAGASTSKETTANRVYMASNTGRFVQATGAEHDVSKWASYFWVAANGVRFGLDTTGDPKKGTLSALNLRHPAPAPWAVVSLFTPGPTLSHRNALVLHSGIAQDQMLVNRDTRTAP